VTYNFIIPKSKEKLYTATNGKLKMENGKLKNMAYYHPMWRHAELVSASVLWRISPIN